MNAVPILVYLHPSGRLHGKAIVTILVYLHYPGRLQGKAIVLKLRHHHNFRRPQSDPTSTD